jgi:hypothetical protein
MYRLTLFVDCPRFKKVAYMCYVYQADRQIFVKLGRGYILGKNSESFLTETAECT